VCSFGCTLMVFLYDTYNFWKTGISVLVIIIRGQEVEQLRGGWWHQGKGAGSSHSHRSSSI